MGRRRVAKELTVEEFEAWAARGDRVDAMAEAADEPGGPRLSLVPVRDQNSAWPTDLLPIPPQAGLGEGNHAEHGGGVAAATHPDCSPAKAGAQPEQEELCGPASTGAQASSQPVPATPFDGIPLEDSRKRLAGWSAERQRLFLETLAETGSVHLASSAARLSARSAYRLRTRSPAFAAAWDAALQLSVGRLAAIVFDRAINGRIEQIYQDGELVAERRVPSDRLLTWLLARLDPRRFALPWEQRGDADPQAEAVAAFPALLEAVTDTPS